MDSRDWYMLKVIGEELSLTKAARRLYISQPSLTQRLHKLEFEFETMLLNRYANGVSFTENGKTLLKYSLEMIDRLEGVKKQILRSFVPVAGKLIIGVSTVFSKYKLAPILKAFCGNFPDVELVLRTGSSTLELPNLLVSGEADLIIKRGDMEWPECRHVLFQEPEGILSSTEIDLARLPTEPWILDHATEITESDTTFRRWWRETFGAEASFRVINVNSAEACVEMVAQGLGWTFLPKIHTCNRKNLRFCPLFWPDGKAITKQTVMLYRRESLEKIAVRKFVDYMLAQFSGTSLF